MRTLVRYIAPGAVSPARWGSSSLVMATAPKEKPSLSRSGSSAITPPTVIGCPARRKALPGPMPSRSAVPSASQTVPGGGAPTMRPSLSRSLPTIGHCASTALSSTGAAFSSAVAPPVAIACIRVPTETVPKARIAASSRSVRPRCQTAPSTSPPRIVRPREASSRSIEPVSVPIAASAPVPRNRQASSSRSPRNRADRSRRAIRQAMPHGRFCAIRRRCLSAPGHRPASLPARSVRPGPDRG